MLPLTEDYTGFTESPADQHDGGAWEWDVWYTTHDLLKDRVIEARRSRVTVLAPDWHTSWKRACWMIQSRHADYYVTRTDCLSWPEEG
jgi:hypothetical protein